MLRMEIVMQFRVQDRVQAEILHALQALSALVILKWLKIVYVIENKVIERRVDFTCLLIIDSFNFGFSTFLVN